MGRYRPLFVLKDSNGFLWVLIGTYAALCVRKGPHGSLYVLIRPCGI